MSTSYYKDSNKHSHKWVLWKGSENDFKEFTKKDKEVLYRFAPSCQYRDKPEEHRFYCNGLEVC